MKLELPPSMPDNRTLPPQQHPGSLRRVRILTMLFIFGLFISGLTAIPLVWEMELLTRWAPLPAAGDTSALAGLLRWVHLVKNALVETNNSYPFLAYGTDWLAFGHFIIALVFVGAYRDPVRNIWLFTFGMIACALVIPFALTFGWLRGIPFGWRLIDCAFGVFAFPLLWLARTETLRIAPHVDSLAKQEHATSLSADHFQ